MIWSIVDRTAVAVVSDPVSLAAYSINVILRHLPDFGVWTARLHCVQDLSLSLSLTYPIADGRAKHAVFSLNLVVAAAGTHNFLRDTVGLMYKHCTGG